MTAKKTVLHQTVNKVPLSLNFIYVSDRGKLVHPRTRLQRLEILLFRCIFHAERYPSQSWERRIRRVEFAIMKARNEEQKKQLDQMRAKIQEDKKAIIEAGKRVGFTEF